jgi:hypothetical protein
VDLALHDARSALAGFLGLTRGLFLRRSQSSRASDTSVAPDLLAPCFRIRPSSQVAKAASVASP